MPSHSQTKRRKLKGGTTVFGTPMPFTKPGKDGRGGAAGSRNVMRRRRPGGGGSSKTAEIGGGSASRDQGAGGLGGSKSTSRQITGVAGLGRKSRHNA